MNMSLVEIIVKFRRAIKRHEELVAICIAWRLNFNVIFVSDVARRTPDPSWEGLQWIVL